MKNHQIKAFQPFGNGGINLKFFVEFIIELMYLNVDQGTIANFCKSWKLQNSMKMQVVKVLSH